MAHHNLKAHPDSFNLMAMRTSQVQIRKNDRGFREGDTCTFYEWEPKLGIYTGHVIRDVPIRILLPEHEGLVPGWSLLVLDLPGENISGWLPTLAGATELQEDDDRAALLATIKRRKEANRESPGVVCGNGTAHGVHTNGTLGHALPGVKRHKPHQKRGDHGPHRGPGH